MKTTLAATALAALGALAAAPAEAHRYHGHGGFGVGVTLGTGYYAPRYYRPAPRYYRPAPRPVRPAYGYGYGAPRPYGPYGDVQNFRNDGPVTEGYNYGYRGGPTFGRGRRPVINGVKVFGPPRD